MNGVDPSWRINWTIVLDIPAADLLPDSNDISEQLLEGESALLFVDCENTLLVYTKLDGELEVQKLNPNIPFLELVEMTDPMNL